MQVLKAIISAGLGGFTAGAIIFLGRMKGPLKDRQGTRMLVAIAAGIGVMWAVDQLLGLIFK